MNNVRSRWQFSARGGYGAVTFEPGADLVVTFQGQEVGRIGADEMYEISQENIPTDGRARNLIELIQVLMAGDIGGQDIDTGLSCAETWVSSPVVQRIHNDPETIRQLKSLADEMKAGLRVRVTLKSGDQLEGSVRSQPQLSEAFTSKGERGMYASLILLDPPAVIALDRIARLERL